MKSKPVAANNADKRLGLCDFRSLSSTPIDRGIENRDASILLGKHIATAMIFSIVFEHMGLGWLGRDVEVAKRGWAGLPDAPENTIH